MYTIISSKGKKRDRRAAVLVMAAIFLVMMFAFLAFAVDLGYLMMAKTQLQAAADSSALAAAGSMGQSQTIATNTANLFAGKNLVGNQPVQLASVTYGTWDKTTTPPFTPVSSGLISNAVKVEASADIPLFFARVLNINSKNVRASSLATCNPRDICFVVDLSGSMNNDTDPNNQGPIDGTYPGVGSTMMQNIFNDFGYGTYSGAASQAIGAPLGVSSIAALIKVTGTPLSPLLTTKPQTVTIGGRSYTIPSLYRFTSSESSSARTKKAYSWVMDEQMVGKSGQAALPGIMPAAKPTPNSADTNNYNYWYSYLSNSSYSSSIGYKSYTSFMMSYGGSTKPSSTTLYTPLSIHSSDCPYHPDTTQKGNTFNFPPREMPTHASRLAIIDALQIVKDRNQNITDSSQCDWVSVVTFDLKTNVVVLHDLNNNYDTAMQDCTTMQATTDSVSCTATETGFMAAINLLNSNGRAGANKVVVLLTDGIPNLYSSNGSAISGFELANPDSNYYSSSSYYPQDAAMMQTAIMQGNNWSVFPIQLGLQGNADFMNRIYSVATGKTTQTLTNPYDATGNPANYETDLIDIFNKIISNPKLRLVQ